MKLDFSTIKLHQTNYQTTHKQQNNVVTSPVAQAISLSNFNSVGRSLISFGSENSVTDLEDKTVEQLIELKKVYLETNKEELERQKKDAREKLDEIDKWENGGQYDYKKYCETSAENEIYQKDLSTFWNPSRVKRVRTYWLSIYNSKCNYIAGLNSRRAVYEQILNTTELNKQQTEIMISNIDAAIKQKQILDEQQKRLNALDNVQESINALDNKQGGLKERIAGYDYEKEQISRMFVDPFVKAMEDPMGPASMKVPSCVLLHGATGTGKTAFIDGIGHDFADKVHVVNFTKDAKSETFESEIRIELQEAVRRYLDEGKRTIILINEAEAFLAISPEEAEAYFGNDIIDDTDLVTLEAYGKRASSVNHFKSLLDTCSLPPRNRRDTTRAATTFFITTNYPHLIHPDLLTRDGKMPYIAINPPSEVNIKPVLQHYFKLAHDAVEKIKEMSSVEDLGKIKGFEYLRSISPSAKANLEKLKEQGRLSILNIDLDQYPFENVAKEYKPSSKKGAFSNDSFRKFTDIAFNKYLEDPSHTFEYYYTRELIKADKEKDLGDGTIMASSRDISPQRYKKFIKIYNMLAPAEPEEKETLLQMKKLGTLDSKAKKRLEYIQMREDSMLKNLEEKEMAGTIKDDEKVTLVELRKSKEQMENSNRTSEVDEEDDL